MTGPHGERHSHQPRETGDLSNSKGGSIKKALAVLVAGRNSTSCKRHYCDFYRLGEGAAHKQRCAVGDKIRVSARPSTVVRRYQNRNQEPWGPTCSTCERQVSRPP